MDLFLVRHPRVIGGDGRCYGRMDLPLAGDPAKAAEHIRDVLPAASLAAARIVSSPATRCRLLAECLHPAPQLEPRLLEMHFGGWEGQLWNAVDRAALDAWAADPLGFVPPGGESPLAVRQRALEWVASLPRDGRPVLAIAHAGPIRMLLTHWMQVDPAGWPRINVDFASVTHVRADGEQVQVVALNQ